MTGRFTFRIACRHSASRRAGDRSRPYATHPPGWPVRSHLLSQGRVAGSTPESHSTRLAYRFGTRADLAGERDTEGRWQAPLTEGTP